MSELGMRVIVLIENEGAANDRLQSEHGLSVLVLAHGRRVLFDTGASGAAVANALALGRGDDLARLDAIVLSHGHADHTGGLAAVLAHLRRATPVFIRPGFFRPRLSTRRGAARTIGVPLAREELEARGARFVEETSPREILPGFVLSGEIPLREETTAGEPDLWLGPSLAEAVSDAFIDEQAMAVRSPAGLLVLVGCAHRGIVNSIAAAQAAAGNEAVHMVVGGAHLGWADSARIAWSVEQIRRRSAHAALGHCTGDAALARFADLGEAFARLRTGWVWPAEASAERG
jgi:7,8-dihydropterin-6-yl-methyl-4-(beta-D-ribofuranosyl)aminobenzene 5'-phosphate synthase